MTQDCRGPWKLLCELPWNSQRRAGSPARRISPALTLKSGVSSGCTRAAWVVLKLWKMLICQFSLRPFSFCQISDSHCQFYSTPGCLQLSQGLAQDSQNHLLQKKNKYAEYSSFSCVWGWRGETCHKIQTSKLGVTLQKVGCAA